MKTLRTICFALAVAIIAGCTDDLGQVEVFRFRNSPTVLGHNDHFTLNLETATIKNGSDPSKGTYSLYNMTSNTLGISFVSRDETVATVSNRGRIEAVGIGTTFVVAESSITGQKDSVTVTVEISDADERTFCQASWNWTTTDGITSGYAQMNIFDSVQSISIAHYDESKTTTEIVYNAGTSCTTTSVAATEAGAKAAINGSFFNTSSLIAGTTFCLDGTLIATSSSSEATNRSTGMLLFKDGKISIESYNSALISAYYQVKFDAAIASGPLLVLDGVIQDFIDRDFNTARHPRTMIGKTSEGEVYMVVVDGRFSGSAAGMTIPEMAKVATYLGLKHAINLDGGGSSTLWVNGKGVMNYPCDNSTWDHAGERRVPTVVIAK